MPSLAHYAQFKETQKGCPENRKLKMITSSAARHVFLITRSGPENNFHNFPLWLETTGPASLRRKFKDRDFGYKVEFMVCLMDVVM